MDDGGVDSSLRHLLEQLVLGEARHLPVVRIPRLAAAPDVDLRVDDHCSTSAPGAASSSQAFTVIDSML